MHQNSRGRIPARTARRRQSTCLAEPAIARYNQLKSQKLNVPGNDLRIAAIALEHGGTLVSRNLRDFRRVPGLSVEDWSV